MGSTHMIAVYVSPIMVCLLPLVGFLYMFHIHATFLSCLRTKIPTFFHALKIISATPSLSLRHPFYCSSMVPKPPHLTLIIRSFLSLRFFLASGVWQLVLEPLAVSVGLATPLQGSALFNAGMFGWIKNVVVLLLVLPNHALLPQ
jgi:hypothetical protein